MIAGSPTEPRKRYYIFSQDFRTAFGDFLFANKDDVLVDGRLAGRREHKVPGYQSPYCTGLPPLLDKPRLIVGLETGTFSDLCGPYPWFVSNRAKELLSEVDPLGFEFAECATVDSHGTALPSYWMMDVTRIFNEFDEGRSSFERFIDANPDSPDALNPAIVALNDIYMSPDLPLGYHTFYIPRYSRNFIVDATVADAWREDGLAGAIFTPLQKPIGKDLEVNYENPDYSSFKNYGYWKMKGALP